MSKISFLFQPLHNIKIPMHLSRVEMENPLLGKRKPFLYLGCDPEQKRFILSLCRIFNPFIGCGILCSDQLWENLYGL